MIFQERKTDKWEYETTDLFGTIKLFSDSRLDPKELDSVVMWVLDKKSDGEAVINEKNVIYEFDRASDWIKDDECKESKESPEDPTEKLCGKITKEK